ncbi:uncharacterized protein NPIL_417441 [Nephila pilipes]|uniref:Uncharacterized protein n=1 Tax=Nephila pilipes TaxID=299642 RepID=A0A8X6UJ76_NEPPI|nr:uncharacterized protein NPIL_417441 [Nephila pilipes]
MSLLSHRPYSHLDNDEDIFLHRRHRKIHKKKLHRCLLGTVVALSLLLAVVVVAAIQVALFSPKNTPDGKTSMVHRESSAAFEDALVVRTNCGEYIGTIEDGAFVFKDGSSEEIDPSEDAIKFGKWLLRSTWSGLKGDT